jgi:hypothetical protein
VNFVNDFHSKFNIALLMIGILDSNAILESCEAYRKMLKDIIATNEKLLREKKNELPIVGQIFLNNIIRSRKVELKTANEVIKAIESGEQINKLPVLL